MLSSDLSKKHVEILIELGLHNGNIVDILAQVSPLGAIVRGDKSLVLSYINNKKEDKSYINQILQSIQK